MEVHHIIKNLEELSKFQKPKSNKDQNSWKETTKLIYDFIKREEKQLGLPCLNKPLSKLHIQHMDAEQVWQQLELQNSILIADLNQETGMDESNLCVMIASLCNKVKEETIQAQKDISDDEGVDTGDELENNDSVEETSDLAEDLSDAEEVPDNNEGSEVSDLEDDGSDELSELGDLDADTFGDIALEESDDEAKKDQNNTNEGEEEEQNTSEQLHSKPFKSTFLDSQFFNLRESEWISDSDIIGKDFSTGDEKFDFMEDDKNEHSDDEGAGAMYDDFFDPPNDDDSFENSHEGDTEEVAAESDEEEMDKSSMRYATEDNQQEKEQSTSRFEESLKKESDFQDNIVDKFFVGDKPWILKGEVDKEQRPENSALEEQLEYNVAVRQKPLITEETTQKIEKLLLTRIRSRAWDDVERRIKPNADPVKFKRDLILDQEKSKKSLAAIYEEEFIKKQQEEKSNITKGSILLGPEEKIEELPIHREIKKEMNDLFKKLDALSNFHYLPKYRDPEVKVVSNLPAVTIEEATPTTASDATLLAPQEVVAPLRGELKGEREKTSTDKKRERRSKKNYQKAKAKREESKLNHQMKKKDRDGLAGVDASVKMVQKAFKKGQIRTLESDQQSVKSSTGFFTHLHDNLSNRNKKRKSEDKDETQRKKKRAKGLTMTKLLL